MKTTTTNQPHRNLSLGGLAALLIIATLSATTGCSTAGLQAGDSSLTNDPYLLIDDSTFGRQIAIVKVAHDYVGELMRANVTLKSNRGRSLLMQYRFSWYDSNGMEIDGRGQPYRDLIIEGRDTVNVTSVAPSPAATEFKIRVRKVKAIRIENIR